MPYIERPKPIRDKTPKRLKRARRHVSERAVERYGEVLDVHDQARMKKIIQDQQAVFVRRKTNTVTEWVVTLDGKRYRCFYSRTLKAVCTVLPMSDGARRAINTRMVASVLNMTA